MARREHGTGSVFQRADGMWIARITLPSDGSARRRKQVARARKEDAVRALRDMRKELDRTGDLPTASPTLATWLDQWHARMVAPVLKPRTSATYRSYLDQHVIPSIGRIRLDRLTVQHVYRLHESMEGRGLSTTTALQAHRILAKALGDAEREGRVGRNVAALATAPRRRLAVRPALTAEQAITLLQSVADDPYEAPRWSLALLAGLRQGEALGLTTDALDMHRPLMVGGEMIPAGRLTVSWQLQRLRWSHGCGKRGTPWPCGLVRAGSCPQRTMPIPADQEVHQVDGGLWLTRPKSRAGWREVPTVGILHEVLTRHLDNVAPGRMGLVLHRGDGRPVDPSRDAQAWDAALRRAGLPDVPLHSARHTCSSLLAQLGVPEHIRMQILGHSSATVTRGYTHLTGAEAADAMGRLSALLDWRAIAP